MIISTGSRTLLVRITYARIDMTDELGTNTVSFQD